MKLALGTVVQFTRNIYEAADDHSPGGYWAWKGQFATVSSNDGQFWDYYVRNPRGHGFGVKAEEIQEFLTDYEI
jgi:hypothetical protein